MKVFTGGSTASPGSYTSVQPLVPPTEGSGGDSIGEDTIKQDGTGGKPPPPLKPSLSEALKWFKDHKNGFTPEQIEAVYSSFEATKTPDGVWRWGKGVVSDWKMAMTSRLLDWGPNKAKESERTRRDDGAPPPASAGKISIGAMRI